MATPIRSCLACRRRADKATLLRLVAVDGTVTVDPAVAKPGRGAYLCDRSACLRRALDNNGAVVARALRLPRGTATVDTDALRAARHASAGGARTTAGAGARAGNLPGVSE
ncbi:MAG: YlxR family protein [Euzebyaceae bacterium]|nr:YlxR family protein [Euzebyaceae bacterium]